MSPPGDTLSAAMVGQPCSWCGVEVRDDEGFRAAEPAGERRAVFCRLEHIVPWAIQGAHWEPGTVLRPGDSREALGRCVRCGKRLEDTYVLLVRHRGEHRIADGFCGVDHLLEWAKAGGRWA